MNAKADASPPRRAGGRGIRIDPGGRRVLIGLRPQGNFQKSLLTLFSMLFYWLLFFFLAMGAKVIFAFVMIYLLLPVDRRCNQCDEDTLLIQPNRLGRIAISLSLWRLEWRWCPRCHWEGLARSHGGRGRPTIRIRQDRAVDAPISPESP